MAEAAGILFCTLIIAAGCFLLYGTHARWTVLVDPPSKGEIFLFASSCGTYFGPRAVVLWTYLLGLLFVSAGLLGLWNGYRR